MNRPRVAPQRQEPNGAGRGVAGVPAARIHANVVGAPLGHGLFHYQPDNTAHPLTRFARILLR